MGKELFTQWRPQAEAHGFGPCKAQEVIRKAKETEQIHRLEGRTFKNLAAKVKYLIHTGREVLEQWRSFQNLFSHKVEQPSHFPCAQHSKDHEMTHSH